MNLIVPFSNSLTKFEIDFQHLLQCFEPPLSLLGLQLNDFGKAVQRFLEEGYKL